MKACQSQGLCWLTPLSNIFFSLADSDSLGEHSDPDFWIRNIYRRARIGSEFETFPLSCILLKIELSKVKHVFKVSLILGTYNFV
jgi:hypothetical protein